MYNNYNVTMYIRIKIGFQKMITGRVNNQFKNTLNLFKNVYLYG